MTNKKTILRNTLLLQVRKVVTILISLYTSRLLLQTLGVEDFGLYGLIGSILLMFESFKSLFASSIQRFINVSRNDTSDEINKIFSVGLKIQIRLAIIFFVVVDIVGILTIPHFNIPSESVVPSYWILQMTLLASVVTIITVPYDAVIISYEKFTIYAVLSFVECFLKLFIVILLCWNPFNRVVYYSVLMLIVSLIIRFLNYSYCRIKFGEIVRYKNYRDKCLMKEMMSFAGWQFLGNTGYSLMMTGLNFVLNIYGGLIVNAARSISAQVHGFVTPFIAEINLAFKPRSMMLYKANQMDEFYDLFYLNAQLGYMAIALVAFPLIILTPQVLYLWLGSVPQYSVEFVRAILLFQVLRSLLGTLDIFFTASGKLAVYQISNLIITSLCLPISWIGLHYGMPLYGAMLMLSVFNTIQTISIILLANYQFGLDLKAYFKNILIRVLVSLALLYLFYHFYECSSISLDMSIPDVVGILVVSLLYVIIVNYTIVLRKQDRHAILLYITSKLKK